MDDFAGKPLTLDELAAALSRWLPAESRARVPGPARAGAPDDVAARLSALAEELGSRAAAQRIADAWLKELPERLHEVALASARDERERLGEAVHAMKSSCALLGAMRAAELAGQIEQQCRVGSPARESVHALLTAAESAEAQVRFWGSSAGAPAG